MIVRQPIPNPDEEDIAPNSKVWWRRFWEGRNHVSYAGIITAGIGAGEAILSSSIILRVTGIVLIAIGTGVFVDQFSHLFTN